MTSSATSSHHLSKLERTVENATSDSFGLSFSGVAFCLPHHLVGVLFVVTSDRKKLMTSSYPVLIGTMIKWSIKQTTNGQAEVSLDS